MSRSKWKKKFIDQAILKIKNNKTRLKQRIYIWSRRSVIPFFLIGKTIFIHNGKEFKKMTITREKVGYKIGEFCTTKKYTPKQK